MEIKRVTLPNITCSVCNKLVDDIELYYSPESMTRSFRVWCHGDTDICEITDMDLYEINPADLQQGVAFTTKRLQELNKQLINPKGELQIGGIMEG